MKCLSVLGSTGSIGCNVLNIVEMFPQDLKVSALAAKNNLDLLSRQIVQFKPDLAAVFDERRARQLKDMVPAGIDVEILYGDTGYQRAAAFEAADMTVTAMVGAAGLMPTLAAIDAGKTIALANKETLVMAGDLVMRRAAENGVDILPIDSEHSAIFQCHLSMPAGRTPRRGGQNTSDGLGRAFFKAAAGSVRRHFRGGSAATSELGNGTQNYH